MFFGTQRPLTEERRLCWMGSTATTENKAIYRRIIAAIGEGDERILREFLAADLIDHNPISGQAPGAEGFLEWMRTARASFPDLSGTTEEVLTEGDRVVGRVTWRGTHRGVG